MSEKLHIDPARCDPRPLPMSREEARGRGIGRFDVILVTGDAYVDHPSFGTAVIGRVLEAAGWTVGIIAQPEWRTGDDFARLGEPRLFFGVSAGNVDSLVNHYTAARKRRSSDAYSPGGAAGRRPDRAVLVYADRIHALFPDTPLVLGGIEASLRRFAHYDYWSDTIRQSVLADAPADLLVYGMGERQVLAIAEGLDRGDPRDRLREIPGTAAKYTIPEWREHPRDGCVPLPSYGEILEERERYAEAFRLHAAEQDPVHGRCVAQPHPKCVIVQNRPARPLSTGEMDLVYELPYTRLAHPSYREPVPALEPVRTSLVSHRGCFGNCSFCALGHHQGRIIQSRSEASILREAERMVRSRNFPGVITDVGGPTANMYRWTCPRWGEEEGACRDRSCLGCGNLENGLTDHLHLLDDLARIPGVKRVFVSSGIRHDLVPPEEQEYLEGLCRGHVGGHLKVAPEHTSDRVTVLMHKPPFAVFLGFRERFRAAARRAGKELYLLPYLMSGHPGCTVGDMVDCAECLRDQDLYTEQVQDFTPTPMTASTVMYATGIDPSTGERVHVPRGREKQIQRALLHYRDPANRALVRAGLIQAGRRDLIGEDHRCLVPGRAAGGRKRRYEP
ncbi:MAG: YgiQ family radical SAM protein [Methanomicrobiales archaeon]|nr:YgiQ family radical SAM protein [Methanomicrobiales archaeon]